MNSEERSLTIIELEDAYLQLECVDVITRFLQPATFNTPEIPCLVIYLAREGAQPIALAYETVEKRDADYNKVLDALKAYRY